jgi:hypothetical protein
MRPFDRDVVAKPNLKKSMAYNRFSGRCGTFPMWCQGGGLETL